MFGNAGDTDMPTAQCLMHVEFEGLGIYDFALRNYGYDVETFLVPKQGVPKSPGDFHLVVGGPMSANGRDPWIGDELAFIRKVVESGKPILGICLGAQMLAKTLGGTVYKGSQPEIGMTTIHLTPEGKTDPVFGQLQDPAEVFEWHGEGIQAPPGAVVMASSPLYPVQAFRYGAKAVGVLFHAEMDRTDIDRLCAHCPADIQAAGLTSSAILQKAKFYLPVLHRWAGHLLDSLIRA